MRGNTIKIILILQDLRPAWPLKSANLVLPVATLFVSLRYFKSETSIRLSMNLTDPSS